MIESGHKQFVPFEHQREAAELWHDRGRMLDFSGCGTGKTLSCIHAVKTYWPDARVLVLGPLSILEPAWLKDIQFGWPETTAEVAYARNREKVFMGNAQWIITNHDAIKTVWKEQWQHLFDIIIIDEGDIFRNRTSDRSRAAANVCLSIPNAIVMTGTPTPNTVLDVWHLAFLIDRGERLGKNYYGFRQQVCTPQAIPGVAKAMKWTDKPMANDLVTSMLADITHRVRLEDVQELPDIITREITVKLPTKLKREYEELKRNSMLMLESGELLNAVHAGSRMQKMLQLLSGAVYNENGEPKDLHTDRHSLVLDMVEETDHALVAFNWHHQKDGLVKAAKARQRAGTLGKFAVIDGSTKVAVRNQIVEQYQNGQIHVIFAHPQSAGHGLTLTKANRIIWASPTYRADLYEQFNHRIYRTGQTRKTEIIHIAADGTAEQEVYEKLMGKVSRMDDLLTTLVELSQAA